jgi:hypothetical protein
LFFFFKQYSRNSITLSLFRPEFPSIPKQKIIRSIAESDAVPRILFEEKEQECLAKDEFEYVNTKCSYY